MLMTKVDFFIDFLIDFVMAFWGPKWGGTRSAKKINPAEKFT
jgi:hypothetical protein